jgi:TP901 family phage tail tape measure protein
MARDLKLEVLLKAVDRATAPLKKITQGSGDTARALKASREQLRDLERAQKDLRGFQRLQHQSEKTSSALREQQARVEQLTREIKNTEGPTRRLNQRRDAAIRKARRLKEATRQQTEALEKAQRAMRASGNIASGLVTQLTRGDNATTAFARAEQQLARRVAGANRELDEQKAKLRQLAEQQRRAARAADQLQRQRDRAGRLAAGGATAAAGGGVALFGMGSMLRPGVEFGAQMSAVQAVMRLERSDPRFQALKAQARDLGDSTSFSATQAAQGQEFLARAGFDAEAILAALPGVLDLAKANRMDLGRTADISSNILSAYGLDPAQMGRVGDVLTATTTRANVNLEMLGNTMKYMGPVAKQFGISLEESAAMAGLLGNVGIQGEQAGTTLRAMMLRVAAPTSTAAAMLKELGIQTADAQGNLRAMPAILADLARATEEMGTATQADYLKAIFGEEAIAGVMELLQRQGTKGITQFSEVLGDAAGANARTAAIMANNIKGDLDGLSSAWEEIGITLTDTNNGALRGLIQSVTEIVRGLGEWMKANPELTATLAKAAAVLAAVVTAGGVLTLTLASMLGPMALVRYGMVLFGLRSGALLAGIHALGAGLLGFAARAVPAVIAGVRAMGVAMMANPIGLAIGVITAGVGLIIAKWDVIGPYFQQLWAWVKGVFTSAWSGIKALLSWSPLGLITDSWGAITGWFSGLSENIMATLGKALSWISDKFLSPVQAIKDALGAAWDALFGGDDEANAKIRSAARTARKAAAAATLGVGAAAGPAAADVPIDTRPAVSAPAASAPQSGGNFTINVYAAPGMDERAIAREVQRLIAEHEHEKAARRRSSLYDLE